jgi:hypothetical protein
MVTFAPYFISLFTPIQYIFSEGEGIRIQYIRVKGNTQLVHSCFIIRYSSFKRPD